MRPGLQTFAYFVWIAGVLQVEWGLDCVQCVVKSSALIVFGLLLVLHLLFVPATRAGSLPLAFPGAEGFGQFARGGRGGEVFHVTTLADAGPGSFRDAVSKSHRIVVFDVSGIIRLESNVAVSSDLTLAGQSAPGDGLMLYGRSVSFSGRSNLIVRYLRFREGIAGDRGKCSVNLSGGSDMIFDHCSIEWGRWDCLGLTQGSHDITFQNCIIGEGLDPQRFGSLSDDVTNITYARNLWINNQSRNPKAKGKIQYVNNVVYNWGVVGLVGGHSETNHFLDIIGNYFIRGASSSGRFLGEFKPTDHIFQSGNYADLNMDGRLNGRPVVAGDFGAGEEAPTFLAASAIGAPANVAVEPAAVAYSNVVAHAGCSLHRDAVDRRLIADVQSLGTRGTTIRDPDEAGGFGDLKEIHAASRSFAGDGF